MMQLRVIELKQITLSAMKNHRYFFASVLLLQ